MSTSSDEREPHIATPSWLRDLGVASWLLVGFVLVIVGAIWLLGETSTIVMPVILAAVLGAVAGPAVGWLQGHGVPRIGGAFLVLLGLVAVGVVVFCLVYGGIAAQADGISAKLEPAVDKIGNAFADAGVDDTESATAGVKEAIPEIRGTLLGGVATGVEALSSLVFFLAFSILSTLFVLKDGPVMHAFINRHLGVPEPVANVVTTNVAKSLRSYFLGVTIIAAFNGVVIGLAAWILGVPLAAHDRRRDLRRRVRPVRGRLGRRRVRRAAGARDGGLLRRARHGGRRAPGQRRAPAADPALRDGRDAGSQPARRAGRDHRRRRPLRDGGPDAGGAAHVGRGAHRRRAARRRRTRRDHRAPPHPRPPAERLSRA